jgi:hypothetical protein
MALNNALPVNNGLSAAPLSLEFFLLAAIGWRADPLV